MFDVTASGDPQAADVARAYEFGALATAAQLVGAGQAMLDMSVEYAKQRNQFGRAIGTYQAIKHKLADVHIAVELARPLVYGAALSLADESPDTAATSAPPRSPPPTPRCWRRARRCRPTARSASPPSTTCRCGCCGCRPCDRRGAIRRTHRRRVLEALVSEERQLLRDTVAALVDKHASPAAVREAMESPRGYDESLWKLLCEQVGAAALVVPEEFGGAGGELADAAVVLEELGKVLVPTPLLGTTLAELALLAADEPDSRSSGAAGGGHVDRRAWCSTPSYVVNGDVADVVVAADGERLDPLDRASPRTPSTPWTPPAGWRGSSRSDTARRSAPTRAWPTRAAILLAAEQIGAAAQCLDLTVEYTKDRVQFGRPIGSFQALKHRMADLYVAVQSARAVVDDAIADPSATSAALARCRGQRSVLHGRRRGRPAARRHRHHLGARHPAVLQACARQRAAARPAAGASASPRIRSVLA